MDSVATLELTILMPCLNEAETIGTCVRKAMDYLARSGIAGEVLVADMERKLAAIGRPGRGRVAAYYQRRGYQPTGKTEFYPIEANVGQPLVPIQLVEMRKDILRQQ